MSVLSSIVGNGSHRDLRDLLDRCYKDRYMSRKKGYAHAYVNGTYEVMIDGELTLPALKRLVKLYRQLDIDLVAFWEHEKVAV